MKPWFTEVAELVDAHVSGACVARREGSSPSFGTATNYKDHPTGWSFDENKFHIAPFQLPTIFPNQ